MMNTWAWAGPRVIVVAAALVAALMAGCRGGGERPRDEEPEAAVARGRPPSYTAVASAYNSRVAPLGRLYSRTVARIWSPGEGEGEERVDQLEGTVQFIRPDKALVTFSKLGEIYGILGSNQEKYWWIELGQNRRAHVGTHARATPERIAAMGLPIHPLDFVDLTGITPLPTPRPEGSAGAGPEPDVRWSSDGRELIVTVPGRHGRQRLMLDPVTYEPSRIEYLDARGEPLVYADLSRYAPVSVGEYGRGPRIATELLVSMDRDRTRARLRLDSPESGTQRPRESIFDLERLLSTRNVREVIDLDAAAAEAAASSGGAGGAAAPGAAGR